MSWCAATVSAPTRCVTRSKLEREYGSRPHSSACVSASREVPCCPACAMACAVCGSQPSPTTPARRLTGSTTRPSRVPPRAPDRLYWAGRDPDLFQFAVGEERDEATVGRPEWLIGAFG